MTRSTEKQNHPPWNTRDTTPRAADLFEARGTREEVLLLFGGLDEERQGELRATAHTRVILSPFTAKGLARALAQVVSEEPGAGPAREGSVPQARASVFGEDRRSEMDRLLGLVQALGVDFGMEKSFKMSPGKLLPDRLLLAVNTQDVTPEGIFAICRDLEMPEEQVHLLQERFPEANTVGIGAEISETRCT